jgi:hypothetical protein
MKMLNRCSRSAHFFSVIMQSRISGFSVVFGIIHMQWLHHQCQLGGDIRILLRRVRLFRRKLPVEFVIIHHISRKVLRIINMKSQFDIYFISVKVFLNQMCSKLKQKFKYSSPLQNARFTFTKHTYINAGIFFA